MLLCCKATKILYKKILNRTSEWLTEKCNVLADNPSSQTCYNGKATPSRGFVGRSRAVRISLGYGPYTHELALGMAILFRLQI